MAIRIPQSLSPGNTFQYQGVAAVSLDIDRELTVSEMKSHKNVLNFIAQSKPAFSCATGKIHSLKWSCWIVEESSLEMS